MISCWIIYDENDLEVNRFFAESLRDHGRRLGMDAGIVTTGSLPEGVPDAAVNRSRDHGLAARLESEGCRVFNRSDITELCNDKAATYRFAESAGIPVMDWSLPGEDLPPGPPWVVKSAGGHGGTEVFMAEDRDGVEGLCGRLKGRNPLIQTVASETGRDIRVYVLGGRVLGAVERTSQTDFRSNYKLGGSARLCDVPEDGMRIVEEVCSRLSPDLIGVDLVFDGGRARLNELEDPVGTRMLYDLTALDTAAVLMRLVHSNMSL